MAMKPDPKAVQRWVEESCRAQGVPFKMTDPKVVDQVAVLLREGRKATRPGRAAGVRG